MIEFDSVTKVYQDSTVAIEDVSFAVEAGTTTVLVGPSGCGKTTTMKLVNRLEDPTEGTVYVDGTDVQTRDAIDLRRNVGYVIQEIGLFDHMTVGENVATVPELLEWDEERIDDRVDELLDLMDLPPETYRDQHPDALSGGQRQRVGVARALAADPEVMLMDEPFGALDPLTREALQDEFLDIQEELDVTILFVTHDIEEALKMGDRIAIYNVGEVVQYDTPQEILANPRNEFVEDFIGGDRALKQLQVTPVRDVMRPVESASASASVDAAAASASSASDTPAASLADGEYAHLVERDDGQGSGAVKAAVGDGGDLVPVEPTDSTQVALSRIIQADTEAVPVVDDGSVVGVVTEADIRKQRIGGVGGGDENASESGDRSESGAGGP